MEAAAFLGGVASASLVLLIVGASSPPAEREVRLTTAADVFILLGGLLGLFALAVQLAS